jgi:hypothetical protein
MLGFLMRMFLGILLIHLALTEIVSPTVASLEHQIDRLGEVSSGR